MTPTKQSNGMMGGLKNAGISVMMLLTMAFSIGAWYSAQNSFGGQMQRELDQIRTGGTNLARENDRRIAVIESQMKAIEEAMRDNKADHEKILNAIKGISK